MISRYLELTGFHFVKHPETYRLYVPNLAQKSQFSYIPERRESFTSRSAEVKSEVAVLQTLSRLFHLIQSVKCWQFFPELNSKRL